MDPDTVFQYWKALKAIRANEQKALIEAVIFPQLKDKKDRDSVTAALRNAVKNNVSSGDYEREGELERILEARRNGERKS